MSTAQNRTRMLALFTAILMAAFCYAFSTQIAHADESTAEPVASPSIAINGSSKVTLAGADKTLAVQTTGDVGAITWKSSKPKVAAVSQSGVVTGKAFGATTITASANGQTLKWSVTVNKVKVTMFDGKSKKLNAYSKYVKKYKKGTWKSSKKTVVSINKGKMKTLKKGKSTLKFKAGKNTYQLIVTVNCKHKWTWDEARAKKYSKRADKYEKLGNSEKSTANYYKNEGELYVQKGDYISALDYMSQAKTHLEKGKAYMEKSGYYLKLGLTAECCKKCGEVKK